MRGSSGLGKSNGYGPDAMTSFGEAMAATAMTVDIDLDLELDAAVTASTAVDFQRPVHALLGLPVDAVDLPAAVAAVRDAAFSATPTMVSTPNLDWVVGALSDAAFRDSVAQSDLC